MQQVVAQALQETRRRAGRRQLGYPHLILRAQLRWLLVDCSPTHVNERPECSHEPLERLVGGLDERIASSAPPVDERDREGPVLLTRHHEGVEIPAGGVDHVPGPEQVINPVVGRRSRMARELGVQRLDCAAKLGQLGFVCHESRVPLVYDAGAVVATGPARRRGPQAASLARANAVTARRGTASSTALDSDYHTG